MKNNTYKQYYKYITIILLINFILINSIFLIIESIEQSKKNLTKIIIKGKFNFSTKKKIKNLISSLKKSKYFSSPNLYELYIHKILNQLPFTENVYLKKKWPNTIYIYGNSINPFAYWNNKYLLDINGKYSKITYKNFQIKKIPFLFGPMHKQKEIVKCYKIINNILNDKKIFLKTVLVTSQYSWNLFTTDNIKIVLGNTNKLIKLKRLTKVFNILKHKKKQNIQYIDLRYKSGIAVKWMPQ